MSALRPESSTVSLPPRERYAAKRKEKARRQGQAPPAPPGPPGPPGPPIGPEQNMEPNQQPPKPLALTLAGQRQRRANEVAYISKRDGIHIKRVVRRPLAPEPALTVPYLPGQEDIPRSDEESDSTNSTILEPEILIDPAVPGLPSANWDGLDLDISMMGIETGVEPVETDDDLVDYDADGDVGGHKYDTLCGECVASLVSSWPTIGRRLCHHVTSTAGGDFCPAFGAYYVIKTVDGQPSGDQ